MPSDGEAASSSRPSPGPPATALAALCGFQLYAFHWGVITPDTIFQYSQALSGQYDDWHPPITAWIWRQLLWIHAGSAPFLVLDSLLYWLGIGALAEAFRRRGQAFAMWAVLVCGALPIPFGLIGSILKDALLTSCCVAATGLIGLYRLTGRRLPWWAASFAGLLLIIASATRFNALFAVVPLLLLLLPERFVSSCGRMALGAFGAALLLAGSGYLINSVALRPDRSQPILSLVNFDLAGIVAHGGGNVYPQLTGNAATMFTAGCYTPALYNPRNSEACGQVEDGLAAFSDRTGSSPIAIWLRAIAAEPGAYARHRIAHLNRNWRWLIPQLPDDAVYMMSAPNDLGLRFTPNAATRIIRRGAAIMAETPFGRPATWLAVAVGLLALAPALPSRRFITGLALSSLFYGCGYALVSVAPDMRYNLWTMLAAMLGSSCAAVEAGRLKGAFGGRLSAAAAMVFAVVGGELIWLGFGLPAPG